MRILKVKKQNKNKNYTPAFESLLTATPMMMSMAIMTAMTRAWTKANEEVTATKETETVTEVTVKKVTETSAGTKTEASTATASATQTMTVIVTANAMETMMTTELAMEWVVAL